MGGGFFSFQLKEILPPSLKTGLCSALSLIDMNIIFEVNSDLYHINYNLIHCLNFSPFYLFEHTFLLLILFILPACLPISLLDYLLGQYLRSSWVPEFSSSLTFIQLSSQCYSVLLSLWLSEFLKGIWIQKFAFKQFSELMCQKL